MQERICALAAIVVVLAHAAPAAAQSEEDLRQAFEGKRVTLRIDMPGTSDGVDLDADADGRTLNYKEYGDRLKKYGVAIRSGDAATVTLVKVKKDVVEFQLSGGGFGTFGDDTSTSVYLPDARKTEREKDLERRIDDERDRDRRRAMERELADLRDRRRREDRRIAAERERLSEEKRIRVAEDRLRGGSRFNLRYHDRVPAEVRPQDVVAILREFVDFDDTIRTTTPRFTVPAELGAGSSDLSALHKGMTRAEAERMFGRPVDASVKDAAGLEVATLVFNAGDQRVTAEFVENVLVRYTISSR